MKVQMSYVQVLQFIRLAIINENYAATISLIDDVIAGLEQMEKQESNETKK